MKYVTKEFNINYDMQYQQGFLTLSFCEHFDIYKVYYYLKKNVTSFLKEI